MTFRDFMETALYDPERGFYPQRHARADFYTAPELHECFAGVLARRISGLLQGRRTVVEVGAGEGLLAEQLLSRLPSQLEYILIERCDDVRKKARARLARFANVSYLSSVEDLPSFAGVLFSNELIDAFPVHVLEMRDGVVRELHIDSAGAEFLGELSVPALVDHAQSAAPMMAEGDRHAVNLEAARWLEVVAEKMTEGCVLTIDYGKKFRGGPNAPRAYHRHTQSSVLSARPGKQDLTACVDFDALIEAGQRCGLAASSFVTLARFMLDGGVQDWLQAGDTAAAFKSRAQVKTLLHPEGMGEAFKVLIQTKRGGRTS